MLPDAWHPSACGEQGLLCQTECIKKHSDTLGSAWAPPPDHRMVLKVIGPLGSNHGPRGGGMRGCARAARANAAVKGGGMVPSKGL